MMNIDYPKYMVRTNGLDECISEVFVDTADGMYVCQKLLEEFPNHLHSTFSYETLVYHGFHEANIINS
jgi:hypothetical protein